MTESRAVLTCDDVLELAGLYVLGVLEPDEHAAVTEHLSTCPELHEELAQLGGVVPALAAAIEPVDAPPMLRANVLDAYRRETGSIAPVPPASVRTAPPAVVETAPARTWRLPSWPQWVPIAAALLIVAVVGAWGLGKATEADLANQRAAQLEQAVAALSSPGASVAILHGSGTAAGANGFAAFPPDGPGYVVLSGLPAAPAGQTYQAWYIVGGQPSSAGLVTVGSDGYAILAGMDAPPETEVVALTLEPAGGSEQPTTQPIIVGEVAAPA